MRIPAMAERIARIERVKEIITKIQKVEKFRLIGLICISLGVSERVAEEYLRNLRAVDFIEIKNGEVGIKKL